MADYVIYELHVGTFTPAGPSTRSSTRLRRAARLGVTAIEIMPVAQFPGARNWGYDGVCSTRRTARTAARTALRRLVDAAHAHGLAVVLDVVYNHLGPGGELSRRVRAVLHRPYQTPWGRGGQLRRRRTATEVRRFVVENALYWVTRVPRRRAAARRDPRIYDFGARHILQEFVERVHEQAAALGRRVQVIAESDLNDPRVVRPPERRRARASTRSGATTSITRCTRCSPARTRATTPTSAASSALAQGARASGSSTTGGTRRTARRRARRAGGRRPADHFVDLHPEPRPGRQPRRGRAADDARRASSS